MKRRHLLLLLLFGFSSCEPSNDVSTTEPVSSTSLVADLMRVGIEARLNRHFSALGSTILVRTPTSTHRFLEFKDENDKEIFITQVRGLELGIGQLERATIEDFIHVNQSPDALDIDDFGGADWIEVIAEEEFQKFRGENISTKEAWATLLQKYPKVIAAVELSSFGWNADKSEGLLYVGALTNTGVGGGYFYAFRRYGSQYSCQEVETAPSWITKANKPHRATTTSRLVSMISSDYDPNPEINVRPRW